jgi:tetratricopeptide (TPR) repeat protein
VTRTACIALLLALLLPLTAAAQDDGDEPEEHEAEDLDDLDDAEGPELGSPTEMQAVQAIDLEKYARARELAQQLLKDDPDSLPGLYVMAAVYHYGESNLPRAFFLIRQARKLLEKSYTLQPQTEQGRYWFLRIIFEEVAITASMDKREEQLEAMQIRDSFLGPRPADHIWPLIKLERWDDALRKVDQGLASEDHDQQFRAMNGLCALEFERRRRVASYDACLAMTERFPYFEVAWSNTGESAMMVLRHDEAERYYVRATELPNNSYGSPWRSLAMIYLLEGRVSEALGALKKAQEQRMGREPHTHQQDQSSMDTGVATLLLALGHSEDAARIGRRVYERPDRAGGTSADTRQIEITGALLFWAALQMRIAAIEEEEAARPLLQRLTPDVGRRALEVEAWTVKRRAVRLLTWRPELVEMIRPYLTGIINIEVWLQGGLIDVLGPGITLELLKEARDQEDSPEAEGYFLALEAEAALARGDDTQAQARAQKALKELPPAEVLLRARVAAVGGEAARRRGDLATRDKLWNQALEDFPAAFRLLHLALPVKVEHDGTALTQDVADALLRSPRLRSEDGGFTLRVQEDGESLRLCLYRRLDALHGCATAPISKDQDETVSTASKAFHDMIMSPKLDLTQADIRSLDGSPTTGRARQDIDTLLQDVSQ